MESKFRNLLASMRRHRFCDDLHSAVCYFKSGATAYIAAREDRSFCVILRDRDLQVDCSTFDEVESLFPDDELVSYEM